jgi:cytochrome c
MKKIALLVVLLLPAAVFAQKPLGIGRTATPDEIKKLDIDVRPDGHGLPEGKGTSAEGAKIYTAKCQSCHGAAGQGGSADRLVDRESGKNWDFATNAKLVKTVGNYWPYATTVFDYVRRAMPANAPGSLTADDTYSLVAWLLAKNEIIAETDTMNADTLPRVRMPARSRFVPDNRKGGSEVK